MITRGGLPGALFFRDIGDPCVGYVLGIRVACGLLATGARLPGAPWCRTGWASGLSKGAEGARGTLKTLTSIIVDFRSRFRPFEARWFQIGRDDLAFCLHPTDPQSSMSDV